LKHNKQDIPVHTAFVQRREMAHPVPTKDILTVELRHGHAFMSLTMNPPI